MSERTPRAIALDFLQEWEDGKSPPLKEYFAGCPGETHEMLDFVADCIVFDALLSSDPGGMSLVRA